MSLLRPALSLAALIVLAGCATTSKASAPAIAPPEAGDVVVRLVGLQFDPTSVTVPTGRRVVWQWTDTVVHNVKSDRFTSSRNQGGGSYAVRFDAPGAYAYRCSLHPGMDGKVLVR